MVEKNKRKLEAARKREEWSCARPQGHIVDSEKIYRRHKQKKRDKEEEHEG